MAEEQATPASEETPSGEEQATEEVIEEEATEEIAEEEFEPPEGQEQKFQAWLGRREAKQDKKFAQMLQNSQGQLLQQIQNMIPREPIRATEPVEFDPYDPKQVESIFDKRERQKEQYYNAWQGTMANLVAQDPVLQGDEDLAKEVFELASKIQPNNKYDPVANAQFAVLSAKAKAFENRVKGKTNPFNGRKPVPGAKSGITATPTIGKKSNVAMPPLSEMAQKLVARGNYTAEEVKKIVEGTE